MAWKSEDQLCAVLSSLSIVVSTQVLSEYTSVS